MCFPYIWQVLKTLLVAIVGLAHDEELGESAQPFAMGVSTHFAMLFAAGATSPAPAPPSSRSQVGEGGDAEGQDGTSNCPTALKVGASQPTAPVCLRVLWGLLADRAVCALLPRFPGARPAHLLGRADGGSGGGVP